MCIYKCVKSGFTVGLNGMIQLTLASTNIKEEGRNVFELESPGHRGLQAQLNPGTKRIHFLIPFIWLHSLVRLVR